MFWYRLSLSFHTIIREMERNREKRTHRNKITISNRNEIFSDIQFAFIFIHDAFFSSFNAHQNDEHRNSFRIGKHTHHTKYSFGLTGFGFFVAFSGGGVLWQCVLIPPFYSLMCEVYKFSSYIKSKLFRS